MHVPLPPTSPVVRATVATLTAVSAVILLIVVGVPSPAVAGEPTVISVGHTDSPKAYWDEEAHNFTLMTENGALSNPLPIEQTTSWLRADSTWTVPDNEAYASFGAPGETFYASPENVGHKWDTLLWQGIGADSGVPVSTFRDSSFTLDLIDYSGPGEMTMFQDAVNPGETPVIFLSSHRPGHQWTPLTAGSHTHLNTIFTAPGVYHLTYRATARLLTGELVASRPQTTTWWVGDKPTGQEEEKPVWDLHPTTEAHELSNASYHVKSTAEDGYNEITVTGEEPVHVTGGIYDTPESAYPTCEFDYVATPDEPSQRYSDYCTSGIMKATITPHPLVANAQATTASFASINGEEDITLTGHEGGADEPSQEEELNSGHIDIGPVEHNGTVVMAIIDKDHAVHDPKNAVLVVNASARLTRRGAAMMKPAFDFIGPEGTAFSLLEQSGAHQTRQIWPGFSTEHLPLALRQKGWDIEVEKASDTTWSGFLTELDGPSHLLPGTIENVGHIHLNWVFRQLGEHTMRVRAVNRQTGEKTAWEELRFRVEGADDTGTQHPGSDSGSQPGSHEGAGSTTQPGGHTPDRPGEHTPDRPGGHTPGKNESEAGVRMDHGHADMAFRNGDAYFDISGSGAADGKRASGSVTFVVPHGVIPFSQKDDAPWVGFSWSPTGGEVRLTSFEGPGTMSVFTPDSFGGRTVDLSSDERGRTMLLQGDHGHKHYAFTFDAPGVYIAEFTFTGDDGQNSSLTAKFDVGAASSDEAESGTHSAPSQPAPVRPGVADHKVAGAEHGHGPAQSGPHLPGEAGQTGKTPGARRASSDSRGAAAASGAPRRHTSAKNPAKTNRSKKTNVPLHAAAGASPGVPRGGVRSQAAAIPQQTGWGAGLITGIGATCLVCGIGLALATTVRHRREE